MWWMKRINLMFYDSHLARRVRRTKLPICPKAYYSRSLNQMTPFASCNSTRVAAIVETVFFYQFCVCGLKNLYYYLLFR